MKRTYVGIVRNEVCDMKIFVLAENAGVAKARVLDQVGKGLGRACREEDLQIIPFGSAC